MANCKYIFVCGGVISGIGKGISTASIGLLLKQRGHKVQLVKFDPYLNINAGILSPREHGETYVCNDGTEADLDLGSYERITGIEVSGKSICTSGTIYKELISEQERGDYLGQTIQIIPHVTNKIQDRLYALGENAEIVIAEIGGTVGDIESSQFYEAMRQFKQKHGEDVMIILVSPILWVDTISEFKTKPLQNSVRELQRFGLMPDIILCRINREADNSLFKKISELTSVSTDNIFPAPDVSSIYEVPISFYNSHLDDLIADKFRLKRNACRIHKHRELVEKYINNDMPEVEIGIIGKYENCDEAYVSLKEALFHAALSNDVKVKIRWVKADDVENCKDIRGVQKILEGLSGVIIPGGFDSRGVEGKIKAIRYAREKKVPFLGICLGLQCAVIEFARNVCNMEGANSTEFAKTTYPVVHSVPGFEGEEKKSGTMRLGAYDCDLVKESLCYELYGKKLISERHRHRFEINGEYLDKYAHQGFNVVGKYSGKLVEIMELDRSIHPFFIGTQAHPEFKSKLVDPAPLFIGLVKAAFEKSKEVK